MGNEAWKNYFDHKAEEHGASVKTSDYFDDASFFMQRDNLLRWLGPVDGLEILDAGCGVGAFSEPLVKNNTVYGVDFSEKSLAFAAKRGLVTLNGDLAALPFPDGKFDVVFCIGVIQLIPDSALVLKELSRVTKPGGVLLVQTLHKGSIQRTLLALVEKEKKFDRLYTMEELEQTFADNGFADISFQKLYHPFRCVTTGSCSCLTDCLCTSFAIKGRKQGA